MERQAPRVTVGPSGVRIEQLLLYDNMGNGRDYGGEVSLNWAVNGRWRMSASYAMLRLNLKLAPDSTDYLTLRCVADQPWEPGRTTVTGQSLAKSGVGSNAGVGATAGKREGSRLCESGQPVWLAPRRKHAVQHRGTESGEQWLRGISRFARAREYDDDTKGLRKNLVDLLRQPRPWRIRWWRPFVLWALLAQTTTVALWPQSSGEYEVKAAFLYKFASFVDWPEPARNEAVGICIVGRDPFGSALERVVEGKTIGGRGFVVRRLKDWKAGAPCHILFVGGSDPQRLRAVLGQVRHETILTVGDVAGLLRERRRDQPHCCGLQGEIGDQPGCHREIGFAGKLEAAQPGPDRA